MTQKPESSGLRTTLCRDPQAFEALGPEWESLHRRCATATPFQTHAWLHSWWLSYGSAGRLRLVLVRRDGCLVGAAALMLAHRPLPVLVPLGGGISDFFDVLLDDACSGPAAHALARGLHRVARTSLVDLREVRPGAAAERILAHWPGPVRSLTDSVCLELPALPMDQLLARLPASSARRSRGKLRRLDRLGIEHRSVPEHEVPAAVATLLELHGMQWLGRRVTPEHLRPRFAEHLARATRQMVGTGDATLTQYRIGERIMAADVTLMSPDLAGGYLYGVHPDLRAKADVTTMLLRHDTALAASTGRSVVSLLRGTEPSKRHWRPVQVANRRLILAQRPLGPVLDLYAAQVTGWSRLAELLRQRLPALRTGIDQLRARAGRR
ncbi:GNAT family N-acetyltransferase [Streptomyces meridianus]|uniref:GNAT family N-acetyltransferase n=1 Tax=Streptomyces meridianus TaxID=2938945 RepID=A0ABT0X6U5_9ACTN|nr:GNAT family N-acetyltransferase [Streptomyces meridianus]MCM2578241.1 GNAT family N-acetyltransferase [Streptomyces meridianus]